MHVGGFGGRNAPIPGESGGGTRKPLGGDLGAGAPTQGQLAVKILEGTPWPMAAISANGARPVS